MRGRGGVEGPEKECCACTRCVGVCGGKESGISERGERNMRERYEPVNLACLSDGLGDDEAALDRLVRVIRNQQHHVQQDADTLHLHALHALTIAWNIGLVCERKACCPAALAPSSRIAAPPSNHLFEHRSGIRRPGPAGECEGGGLVLQPRNLRHQPLDALRRIRQRVRRMLLHQIPQRLCRVDALVCVRACVRACVLALGLPRSVRYRPQLSTNRPPGQGMHLCVCLRDEPPNFQIFFPFPKQRGLRALQEEPKMCASQNSERSTKQFEGDVSCIYGGVLASLS